MSQHKNEVSPVDGDQSARAEDLVLPLYGEDLAVSRRTVERATVRVATVTHRRDHAIDETLAHEGVEVTHVPIGRIVDAVPPVREEGDVTIMSVVEEVIVVERRLQLKEEVHIRRIRTTEKHLETVVLREQEAVVTRLSAGERGRDVS
jgi:stress response protein YsnF